MGITTASDTETNAPGFQVVHQSQRRILHDASHPNPFFFYYFLLITDMRCAPRPAGISST